MKTLLRLCATGMQQEVVPLGGLRAGRGSTCGMHFLPLCGYVLIVSLGKPQDAVYQHGCAIGGRRQDDEGTTTER